MKSPEVICVGQAVVDCITRGREEIPGKLASRAESISLSIGGDAVNESIALAQSGHSAGVVCAVGEDLAGNILRDTIAKYGVDTTGIRVMQKPFMTPIANLMVSKDGSRTSVNSPATMLPGFVPDAAAFAGARVVSFASMFRAPLVDPEILLALAKAAKAAGAVLCADTKLPTFREVTLPEIREVLALVDYIFPNEKEAAFYTGKESYEEMADVFLSYGVKNAVIKTGPEGLFAKNARESFSLPALPVKAVDTTGAGDHFVAGFIGALLEGADFKACCTAGRDLAADSIQYLGGISHK